MQSKRQKYHAACNARVSTPVIVLLSICGPNLEDHQEFKVFLQRVTWYPTSSCPLVLVCPGPSVTLFWPQVSFRCCFATMRFAYVLLRLVTIPNLDISSGETYFLPVTSSEEGRTRITWWMFFFEEALIMTKCSIPRRKRFLGDIRLKVKQSKLCVDWTPVFIRRSST